MQEYRKCNSNGCKNLIYNRNKKTKELKKYCSTECRYAEHSKKLTKKRQSVTPPVCRYHLCNNNVSKRTTGLWKIYCSRQCQNKQISYEKSDFSKIAAPKCENPTCLICVTEGRNGHWHKYCSRACAGKHNSIKSREKSKNTCLDRYGVTNPSLSKSIVTSIVESRRKNYSPFTSKALAHLSSDSISNLTNKEWLENENKTKPLYIIAHDLGISASSLGVRFRNFGLEPLSITNSQSIFENEIRQFIEELGLETIYNDRTILKPKEIDIFLPEYMLGIECNGTYWHSELQGKDKNYHLNKTIESKKAGIDIIHITNVEWKYKNPIIRSILLSRFNKSTKIYARNCVIGIVEKTLERQFMEENHIQGFVGSSHCYGLYFQDTLISVMSFGKSRYDTKRIELLRFCNKLNHNVIGGASKLFKYFLCNNSVCEVVSYCHKDKFTGNLYSKLGFTFSHSTGPAYYYTQDYENFENRLKYQKHKLSKLLPVFNSELTEWQNMQNNGYDRIWDCGNDVWHWKHHV